EDAFAKLVERQIAQGTNGLVPCGTTGESPTLSHDEHRRVTEICIEVAKKRVPVIAGCGSNSTDEAIGLMEHAQKAGADAALIVTPYYNKPTQEGLYQHFKAIAEAVDIPMILYNVPGRTVADISNDTALRLAQIPGIVGIKDATGNIARGCDLLQRVPDNFAVYSGDDATALALLLLGGHGTISVTANVAPRLVHEMCAAAFVGDLARAREINTRLFRLHIDLFVEANPIPVKWAVARMGLINDSLRLPLTVLSSQYHELIRKAMLQAGITV
ncbi:MAG: 4-hydroxy-tetrahydrodipicolinate synthase, partial [Nitrosomonas sp.]|nr:4-hydroxy-tetrahydrodipicolinate synthase [Nitrosomonas sp.]